MQRRGLDERGQTRNLGKKIFIDGSFKLVYFTVCLALHETDERTDDKSDAGTPLLVQEGRHLVDQRLARARGQQGEGAADQSEVSIAPVNQSEASITAHLLPASILVTASS